MWETIAFVGAQVQLTCIQSDNCVWLERTKEKDREFVEVFNSQQPIRAEQPSPNRHVFSSSAKGNPTCGGIKQKKVYGLCRTCITQPCHFHGLNLKPPFMRWWRTLGCDNDWKGKKEEENNWHYQSCQILRITNIFLKF